MSCESEMGRVSAGRRYDHLGIIFYSLFLLRSLCMLYSVLEFENKFLRRIFMKEVIKTQFINGLSFQQAQDLLNKAAEWPPEQWFCKNCGSTVMPLDQPKSCPDGSEHQFVVKGDYTYALGVRITEHMKAAGLC